MTTATPPATLGDGFAAIGTSLAGIGATADVACGFLADLLATLADTDPRPDLDAYYAAAAAHRAAVAAVRMARGDLDLTRRAYGYGRRSDAAARRLRAALRTLDATPDPGPVDPDGV